MLTMDRTGTLAVPSAVAVGKPDHYFKTVVNLNGPSFAFAREEEDVAVVAGSKAS